MSPHIKKLIGTFALIFWIALYAAIVMRIAIVVLPDAHGLVTLLFYAVAGTIWIVPFGLALPWMYRQPAKKKLPR